MIRRYAGSGPAHSPLLDAWLHPTATRRGPEAKLRISDSRFGAEFWPTREEALQRSSVEQVEARDRDINEREQEIERLRAELAQRGQ